MSKKNSNKTLWILFAVLFVTVLLIFTNESTKNERSFRKELISIDTSSVTAISLFPKSQNGKEVKLKLDDNTWKVTANNGNEYTVPKTKIDNLISEILRIKPKRIVARSKSKWGVYEIDSSSTRIVVKEGSSVVLDLLIGKFAFQQPRSMSTFVKLDDDNDVYEVDGFLNMTFNKDANSFRNEIIVKSSSGKWNKLSFVSDSLNNNFDLIKVNSKWSIAGIEIDSAKTVKYLNELARLTNTDYVDIDKSNLPKQVAQLTIEVEAEEPIVITAYRDSTNYIIHSSLNNENYFDGDKVADKIFYKEENLMK